MKKQFRLFDVYRCIATGEQSQVQGIKEYDLRIIGYRMNYNTAEYDCERQFHIEFVKGGEYDCRFTNETELKKIITKVNKNLDNCRKSGWRKGRRRYKND